MVTCLQIHTIFCVGRRIYLCQVLNIHGVNDVWHTETLTAQSLVPEDSSFEGEIAVG
jgi:hypothetical protein